MKLIVINGPNLNMLGIREPQIYGKTNYKSLVKFIKQTAKELGVKVSCCQFNCEGKIVSKIQKSYNKVDGIIINPGAYTHTSVAILDALKAVNVKTVEVHISNVDEREEFRKLSYVSLFASRIIKGEGINGYKTAMEYFVNSKN